MSFVLRDVICTNCNDCRDLDLCRDPHLQVRMGIHNTARCLHACCLHITESAMGMCVCASVLSSVCTSDGQLSLSSSPVDYCKFNGQMHMVATTLETAQQLWQACFSLVLGQSLARRQLNSLKKHGSAGAQVAL